MKILAIIALFILILPSSVSATGFNPNNIISDYEFTDIHSMTRDEIHDFLGRGALGSLQLPNWQGDIKYAADIIYESALNNGVSPKVIITLLQKEQSLITSQNPTNKQLDWAAGYAVCDDCSMDDPRIQRWRGFGKQVNSATLQFTEGYFADINRRGTAIGKYGPGIAVVVSGEEIVPENAATAALYAYTPHIHGNRLFHTIYNNWFPKTYYPNGSLIKSAENPEVYLIRNNRKHHITTYAVFSSMYEARNITIVDQNIIDSIATGNPISFPNFSILRANNTIYLINGDTIQPFASKQVFNKLGFVDDEIIDIQQAEISAYNIGQTITENTKYPGGRLVRLTNSGSIFYIEGQSRHFVNPELLELQFSTRPVFDLEPNEIANLIPGRPVVIADGFLVRKTNDEQTYLVENGKFRPINNKDIFDSYGWREDQVTIISNELFQLHEIGSALNSL